MMRDKWNGFSKLRKRLFAGTLAVAVLSTSFGIGSAVNADSSENGRVVVAFAALPEEIAWQELPLKSSEADIRFPDELDVIIYSESEEINEEMIPTLPPSPVPEEEPREDGEYAVVTPAPSEEPGQEGEYVLPTEVPTGEPGQEGENVIPTQTPTGEPGENGENAVPTAAPADGNGETGETGAQDPAPQEPPQEGGEPAAPQPAEENGAGAENGTGAENDAGSENPGPVSQDDTTVTAPEDTQQGNTGTQEGTPGEISGSAKTILKDLGSLFALKVYAAENEGDTQPETSDTGYGDEFVEGEHRILQGVRWELDQERSPYGSVFQAAVEGDVFYYVPDISAFGLTSEAELPTIRVTITSAKKEDNKEGQAGEAAENEEEPEMEFKQFVISDGVRVTMEAPAGVFPEDAVLTVRRISDSADQERIEQVIRSDMGMTTGGTDTLTESYPGGDGDALQPADAQPAQTLSMVSFDITVVDADGNELQPDTEFGEVRVTFQASGLFEQAGEGAGISVYHFDEGLDSASNVGAQVDASEETVSVSADHLSVFTVAVSHDAAASSSSKVSVTDIVSSLPKADLQVIQGEKYTVKGNVAFGSTFTVSPANATQQKVELELWQNDSKVALDADGGFTAGKGDYTLKATVKGGVISPTGAVSDFVLNPPITVKSKDPSDPGTKMISVGDYSYSVLQQQQAVDAYLNKAREIKILPKSAENVQYLILKDEFITSDSTLSERTDWSKYSDDNRPQLRPNQINYIYVQYSDDSHISSRGIWEDETAPQISKVSASVTKKKAEITIEAKDMAGDKEGCGISTYYVLGLPSSQKAPTADEIMKAETGSGKVAANGSSGDFTLTLPNKDSYTFYAVVKDKAGNVSEVSSSSASGSNSASIEVMEHVYTSVQGKDKIDDYTKEQKEIKITADKKGPGIDHIEYYICDTFYSSMKALEMELQKSATSEKAETVQYWSIYNNASKPALKKDQLNYIYAKLIPKNESTEPTYLSSCGIWEDEIKPKVDSVSPNPKETTAEITVKGTDAESGIKYYYILVKKKDDATPKPKDVVDSGKKEEEGSFSVDGLTAKTDYIVYAVIEDKAGNISDVKSGKLTTKEAANAASSASSGSGSSGSSGSSGQAASGSSSSANPLTPGPSNIGARTGAATTGTDAALPADEKVRDRVPYIVDASDGIPIGRKLTSGWDRIEKETIQCSSPAEIRIDMNGSTVVPVAMLNAFSERDVTCWFIMDDTVTWILNGLSYTELPEEDVDFRVRLDTKNIPAQTINAIADVYPHINLTLSHDGIFGFTALMRLNVGEANKGMYANLYYYNEGEKALDYMNSSSVDNNGYAEFEFTHASDYTVIIRGDALTGKKVVLNSETGSESENKYIRADSMTQKSDNKLWLVIISGLSIVMCIVILVAPSERKSRRSRA